jgi:hypothetical protein
MGGLILRAITAADAPVLAAVDRASREGRFGNLKQFKHLTAFLGEVPSQAAVAVELIDPTTPGMWPPANLRP